MILSVRRQRRVLAAMHSSLRHSDPHLVGRFSVFTRLTVDEEIPRFERVRPWPAAWLDWPGRASPWLQGAVFIPLAAVLLLVVTLLLATSGNQARCAAPHEGSQRAAPAAAALPGVVSCSPGEVGGFGH